MELIVKFGLLVLSMFGYFFWCSRKWNLRIELMPALFCAGASLVVYAGGILNLLQESAYLVFAVGYVLLALALIKERIRPTFREIAFLGVFLALIGYFTLFFRGQLLYDYDDFSHWGLAARTMLYTEAMPVEKNLVTFQAYPLGSSLFIYYVCNILGSTDACMLWAQTMMMVCLCLSLCALLERSSWEGVFAVLLFTVYALIMNIPINTLRIDTMLSLVPVAGVAAMISLRDRPKAAMLAIGMMSACVTNIKNSGFFFAAMMILVYIWYDPRAVIKNIRYFVCVCLLPSFMTWLIWNRHVALVFTNGFWSKHAMSAEIFGEMAAKKSPEVIAQIVTGVIKRFFSFGDVTLQLIALSAIVLLFVAALHAASGNKKPAKRFAQLLALLFVIAVAYQIGIIAMYIFSMPVIEALPLDSYERYERSSSLAILGIALCFVLRGYGSLQWGAKRRCAAACALTGLFAVPVAAQRQNLDTLYVKMDFESTLRGRLRRVIDHTSLERGVSTLFYRDTYDNGFMSHASTYELWTGGNRIRFTLEEFFEDLPDFSQAVCWDSDDELRARLDGMGYTYDEYDGTLIIRK